jgi:hypothetical protein
MITFSFQKWKYKLTDHPYIVSKLIKIYIDNSEY